MTSDTSFGFVYSKVSLWITDLALSFTPEFQNMNVCPLRLLLFLGLCSIVIHKVVRSFKCLINA